MPTQQQEKIKDYNRKVPQVLKKVIKEIKSHKEKGNRYRETLWSEGSDYWGDASDYQGTG